jgi:hypothetical protein
VEKAERGTSVNELRNESRALKMMREFVGKGVESCACLRADEFISKTLITSVLNEVIDTIGEPQLPLTLPTPSPDSFSR